MKTLELFQTASNLSDEASIRLIAQALQEDPLTTIEVIFFLSDVQGQHQLITQLTDLVVGPLSEYDEFVDGYLRLLEYIPDVSSWTTFYSLYGKHQHINNHILFITNTAILEDECQDAINDFPLHGDLHKHLAVYSGILQDDLDSFLVGRAQPLEPNATIFPDCSTATADTMQTCISTYRQYVRPAF